MPKLSGLSAANLAVVQLLNGRDVAVDQKNPLHAAAASMANFVYIVGDEVSKECVLIDCAWDVSGVNAVVEGLGFKTIKGAVYTHYHFDHSGGQMPRGMSRGETVLVEGAQTLHEQAVPIYACEKDCSQIERQCKLKKGSVSGMKDNEVLTFGGHELKFLHTPGHTPGSSCLLVDNEVLFTGDTLFIGACGRCDLPDSNVKELYESFQRLKGLDDNVVVLAGHNYAEPAFSFIGNEKQNNPIMRAASEQAFRQMVAPGLTTSDAANHTSLSLSTTFDDNGEMLVDIPDQGGAFDLRYRCPCCDPGRLLTCSKVSPPRASF